LLTGVQTPAQGILTNMVDKRGSGGAIRRSFYFLREVVSLMKYVMAHRADLRTALL
jgi:hypothetical protein